MTKYRIRLKTGRVIGPFVLDQLHELKAKGHIQGEEEAQVFPTGSWSAISTFDFYSELMTGSSPSTNTSPKEETFVIDLTKLRNKKNESEIEKIDVTHHEPIQELTHTIFMPPPKEAETKAKDIALEIDEGLKLDVDSPVEEANVDDDNDGKTAINPIAQQDIERIRRNKLAEEAKLKAEEEQKRLLEEARAKEEAARKIRDADESTQMIRLDSIKSDLMNVAEVEEKRIDKEAKSIRQKKRAEEKALSDEDDDSDKDESKKKKMKIIIALAVGALMFAFLFPKDDVPKKPVFQHLEPIVEFPIPFDKADSKLSQVQLEEAKELFAAGDYVSLVKAGKLLKSSYENNMSSEEALNLLVRDYAEQLKFSKEDKQGNAQIVFNLIQSKRPFLVKDPNGVIGLNLFYASINKWEAAQDVVSKYLKLYPANVSQDLFAVYLRTLLKVGKIQKAKEFLQPLIKAPEKTRYTYDALIEYHVFNQENDKALQYIDEALKKFPKLVGFILKKADHLIKEKQFKEAQILLNKAEEMNLENNDLTRAKFLELTGLILASEGDVKKATSYFTASLKIEDSTELRMRLADLASTENPQNETDKLIAESKAIKLLNQAKSFHDKKNYELALSTVAKATDFYPGYIPTELFLAKMQLKLGIASQALKTLEALVKKFPDDKSINIALVDAYIETYKFNDAKNRIAIMSGTEIKNDFEYASANGRLYIQMGDPLQAISWLKNSINMNPLNDRDIFLLAELLIKRANFDAARILLNKCMELDPVNADYRIAYSKIIYEQNDDRAAIGYLLSILNEFGENPKVLSEIAIFYYRAGKIKDFQDYKAKLENMPIRDKALYEFLIKAALLDERYKEIPGIVEKLLDIEPGDIEAMMTAGRVLFESGELVESAKWFKRIQERLSTYPKVQYYIAKIKFLSKDYDGALSDVEADLKANGDNDADLSLMAQIWAEKGDLTQAENLYKRAQKINPRAYESLVGLADISTKRNNFDLALDLYKKAMKEKADEPVIHRKIGDVYRLLGQGVLAVESYKMYLEMNPDASDKSQIQSYINLMQ